MRLTHFNKGRFSREIYFSHISTTLENHFQSDDVIFGHIIQCSCLIATVFFKLRSQKAGEDISPLCSEDMSCQSEQQYQSFLEKVFRMNGRDEHWFAKSFFVVFNVYVILFVMISESYSI